MQPPPDTTLTEESYTDKRTDWAADVHLLSTYAFLTNDEVRVFAKKEQTYLIKQAYHTNFFNVTGSKRVDLESLGMVTNWMWFFQRSDVNLRNEWSNYSNWAYDNTLPHNVIDPLNNSATFSCAATNFNPDSNPDGTDTDIMITGDYSVSNQKDIMLSWALLLDGKYRENELKAGVLDYVEKYTRTSGNAPDGLYCYNFCMNTNPTNFQPSGAINLSKFNNIQFEITTYTPPLDPSAQFLTICGPDGESIGVNKPNWRIYDYNYNLTVLEERYNILTFSSGNAGLMYAR